MKQQFYFKTINHTIVDDKNKTRDCKCKSFIIPLSSDKGRNDSLRFNLCFLIIYLFVFFFIAFS